MSSEKIQWTQALPFFLYFFRFLNDGIGRGGLYLGYTLWCGVAGENTFRNWAKDQKSWSNNTDPLQPRILGIDDALRRIETLGYWNVVQYQMGCLELAVCVDEHLGFQDLFQAQLVHKIEVEDRSVFVCKTVGKEKKKTSLIKNNANQRKFYTQT